jgi:mRNA interferase MazF
MEEEYDNWNIQKKKLSKANRAYFHKGEIWFCSVGKNIGFEEDGKNLKFERPVLILRKFNNDVFLGIPLTTQAKEGKYYHNLVSFSNSTAILSQIRLFDAKRLLRIIGKIDNEELKEIKIKIGKIV